MCKDYLRQYVFIRMHFVKEKVSVRESERESESEKERENYIGTRFLSRIRA